MSNDNNTYEDNAGWLGDPNSAPLSDDVKTEASTRPTQPELLPETEETEGVDQADSLGTPRQEAVNDEAVSVAESQLLRAQVESLYVNEADMDVMAADISRPWSLKVLSTPGVLPIMGVLTGVVLLIVGAQAASVLSDIALLDSPFKEIAYGAVGVVVFVILVCIGRVVWLYMKLRTTPLVSLKSLEQLSERALLREQANQHVREAKEALFAIIADYPLEGRGSKALLRAGLKDEEVEKLKRAKTMLMRPDAYSSYEGWMREAEQSFFQIIDRAASRRIVFYGWRVGLKTAALPGGLADSAVTTINAYLMIGDLCQMYQVRTGRWGTFAVMSRVVFNVFAASHMEEVMDSVADSLFQSVGQESLGVLANVGASVGKGVGKRMAEGGVNMLMFRRLGAATVYHLRPMRLK